MNVEENRIGSVFNAKQLLFLAFIFAAAFYKEEIAAWIARVSLWMGLPRAILPFGIVSLITVWQLSGLRNWRKSTLMEKATAIILLLVWLVTVFAAFVSMSV